MDAAESTERSEALSRLARSSHTAFIDDNTMYVWGGYQVIAGEDVMLPSDEIWLCNLNSGAWERREITGDKPSNLSGFCGSHLNGILYIFGGCDPNGYTNQMYTLNLAEQQLKWRKLTDTLGTTPSPRNKHSCWIHRDRLIYFGGYGCKTIGEVQNTPSTNFIVEEMSWTTIGNTLFRCWGWNNEVNVFDTHTATWSIPETKGPVPVPRGCHASALVGNKGYICGGVEKLELDMFSLDLETWTWTQFDLPPSCLPMGRLMHTMTPVSDHTLFVYGGLGTDGNTLNDAWQFNTQKREWTKLLHQHKDKPRVCHTACLGRDNDVVLFGGSSNMCILVDSIAVLRSPSQNHCKDVIVFQTQPYSLFRLCEDFMGKNPERFVKQLNWLPSKLRSKVEKRVAFFSATPPVLTA
ncbi:kelch domain-containing protein 1-like isoform X1 [Labrus mixtus]|uniref:kelch domain-containing protein 1-like isoform X1 n=2 Tax=Labrus mixtus TaxID=508554 RepID=UPI0029C0761D|nr:kelch domain-containing protein 1-like isoform X1 [Labrus mixtus]